MTEPVSFPGAMRTGFAGLAALTLLVSVPVKVSAQQSNAAFLDRYCATCHNERLKSGGLSLAQAELSRPGAQPELWAFMPPVSITTSSGKFIVKFSTKSNNPKLTPINNVGVLSR